MFKRYAVLSVVLVLALALGATAVLAGTFTYTSTIGSEDPTMPVVFISTPNCTGQGVLPVHYEAHAFSVDVSGNYQFSQDSTAGFASLYIFAGSFDPANPFATCIAASNSSVVFLDVALTAGTTYFAVPFDDTFNQFGGAYTLTISGPGNILVGSNVVCTYPLPANAVVYDVPAGAPAFYDADLSTKVNFDLPAGSWKISEFSGDFAKVWIACQAQPIWIPTNAIGAAIG